LDGDRPASNLFEISWFRDFKYGERRDVMLRLENLAVNSRFPADYRTFDELKALDCRAKSNPQY
jgi:hypothetical protein